MLQEARMRFSLKFKIIIFVVLLINFAVILLGLIARKELASSIQKNTEQIINDNQVNLIKSYAWSKKNGLVQYTFQDGTVFARIDI